MDAADLAEKSEAEGRELRRAPNLSRPLIDGGRVRFSVVGTKFRVRRQAQHPSATTR
jgi:hypothetical protein